MNNKKRILLVEDDPNFGIILRDFLKMNDYEVVLAKNGMEGFEKFKKSEFNLCILDVMMPYKDGFTLAAEIKNISPDSPIIFLTAKSMKEDVLKGYKIGADDYLKKPFDSDVLLFKIKAILKRNAILSLKESDETEYYFSSFYFNSKLRHLKFREEPFVKLSPKENLLLKLLVTHINDLMPRELALTRIWHDDNYFTSRSMDVYIAKLRKQLQKDSKVSINNIHGEGFRLIVEQ
tara:strand:- start:1411 stop:2112 length:702 start_codon:yes stop_codon:yes gene_type:complete